MADQMPGGGVGPLHEAASEAATEAVERQRFLQANPRGWRGHYPVVVDNADSGEIAAATDAVLRVVGTHLTREIEAAPLDDKDTGAAWRGWMLELVAALLEHPDA